MGVFGQLGALFWKNVLIRRRHPTYVVLEVVWPVVLFVVLVLMRLGSPPDHRQTCEFQERDLPSAGLMPFLQSSVCTLNNNCSTRAWVAEKVQAQQRFQSMIRDIDPLISKESTVEAFKALPTVTKVLNSIKDIAGSSEVDEIDDKLLLKNLFRNPDKVVEILSDKYQILDKRVAEALMDASLNPFAFVSSFGKVDFKKIVCDPAELERVIILSDKSNRYIVNKFTVSNSLCKIPDDKISDITNELIRQVDVANIIRLGEDLAGMTGEVDIARLIADIADLTDMYMGSSNLLGMMEMMPDLSALSAAMREFGKMVPLLSDMQEIDFGQLTSLLDFAAPLLKSLTNDAMDISAIQALMNNSQNILSSLNGDMDWNTMVEQLPELMNNVNLQGLGLPLTVNPFNDVYGLINNMMNGSITVESFMAMSMNDTLDSIEEMMVQIYGSETTNMMMSMATNIMEMMQEYTVYTDNIQEDLLDIVSTNEAVIASLNSLNSYGEYETFVVLKEFIAVDNFYGMMTGEMSMLDVCKKSVTMAYDTMPSYDVDTMIASVCTPEATQVVDQVYVDNSYTEVTYKLQEHMTDMEMMMSGTIPDHQEMMHLKDMYPAMTNMMTDMLTPIYEEWTVILANTNIDTGSVIPYWSQLDSRYSIQMSSMMPTMMMGRASESMLSLLFEMTDAVLHATTKRVHMFEDMNGKDKTITYMFKYLPYYPDIVKSAINNNITKLILVVMQNNTSELSDLLCNKTEWNMLNMTHGGSRDELRQFICRTDLTDLFWELMAIGDPLAYLADIEREYNDNVQTEIDWPRMAENLQYVFATFSSDNDVADIFISIIHSDISWITNYYTVILDSLTTMTTTQPAGQPTSWEMTDQSLVQGLESLDKALEFWDLWNRVKHYALTWNLMAKAMNKYGPLLNDPSWNITSYLSDLSPTLGGILSEATVTMPEVIAALERLAHNPSLLTQRIEGLNFTDFCGDPRSFSMILDLVNTPELIQLQNDLCMIDGDAVMSEIDANDKDLGAFIKQWEIIMTYDTDSLPPLSMNWTDIVTTTQKFAENANNGLFDIFMPSLSMFGLNNVNSSVSDLSTALQTSWNFDLNQITGAIQQLQDILYNLNNTNDQVIQSIQYLMASESYMNYHLMNFLNIHLGIINSTRMFNLSAHLNSPEANKVLHLLEQMPELNDVLLTNVLLLNAVNTGVPSEWLGVNFETICTDTATFESVLKMPDSTNLTKAEVIDAVCAVVDFEKLYNEVRYGMDGLDELLTAMENIFTGSASEMMVVYSKLTPSLELFEKLLSDLSSAPITSVGLPLSNDGDLDKLQQQFESFLMDLDNTKINLVDPFNVQQFDPDQTLQNLEGLEEIGEISQMLRILEMYNTVIRIMMNETLEIIEDPVVGFADYPEMYKTWKLMDKLPHLYAVFAYTSMVDNAKITKFFDVLFMGPEALCKASPSDLMTDPPILNIKFEEIFNLFCSINFEELEKEANAFVLAENISATYDRLWNGNETGSFQAWMVSYGELTMDWDRLAESTDVLEFLAKVLSNVLPGYSNVTIWEEIMGFLDTTSAAYDPMKLLELNQQQMLQSFEGLIGMAGADMSLNFLHVSETYMVVLTAMIDQTGVMLTDPAVGFQDYPEMHKMWEFMDWLPHLYTVFTYTSLVDNHKISVFFGAVMAGPETICSSNPYDLMTDPPVMNISFQLIFNDFCAIDISALEMEMSTFIQAEQIGEAYDALRGNSSTNETTFTSWSAANERLTAAIGELLNQSPDFQWPDFYNETLWNKLMMYLDTVLQTIDINDMVADSNKNFMQALSTVSPDFNLQIQISDVSYDLLEMMLDRLDNMKGDNLADFFYGYVEIQKLMLLLQEPHVMEMMAYSVNTPKFTELLSMGDQDVVIDELCTSDFSKYFTVPPSVTLNLTYIQERFCDIDLHVLAQQFEDMAMVDQIMDKLSSNYTIDWDTLDERNRNLTARITALIENPPMLELPSDWMNETFWLELMVLLNGPQAPMDPSMEGFLKQLQIYLGSEYSALIEAWGPVTSLIDMNMEAKRAFATVDLYLGFLNKRMQEISVNVTVETLSQNSTDIIALMEALGKLRTALTSNTDNFNQSVDAVMLLGLLADTDLLRMNCDVDTAAQFISKNYTVTVITQALAELICFDPNMWQQVLEDQIEYEEFERKLMHIWDSSNTNLTLNWTSVSYNIEIFVTYFMSWIEAPPSASNSLMQWANWDGALDFLNILYADPNLLMNILGPTLGIPPEVIQTFSNLLSPFVKVLMTEDLDELFANPEKFLSVMSSLASVQDWLDSFRSVYNGVVENMTMSRDDILQNVVCDGSEHESDREFLAQTYPIALTLCGVHSDSWMGMLRDYGFPESDLDNLQQIFDDIVDRTQRENMEQDDIMKVLIQVVEQLNIDMFIEGYYWTDWLASIAQGSFGRDDYMSLLQLMENEDSIDTFNTMLLVIVEVENYVDMMLNNITGNHSVPLIDILPDPESIAQLITDFADSGSFSTLLMSSVDPARFLTLMLQDDWNETVCNETLFQETFYFDASINGTEIQHDLCTNIETQQYYITEISKAIDISGLFLKIEEIVNSDNVTASSKTWNYMTAMLETIIAKMFQLDRVDMYSMDTWEGTMLETLNKLMNTTDNDSLQQGCDQLIGSLQGVPGLNGYLNSIDSFIHISYSMMNVQINMNTAICESDWSDTQHVIERLEELGVADDLAKVTNILYGQTTTFSCDGVHVYSSFVETFITSIMKAFDGSSDLGQCVSDAVSKAEDLLMDISKLFSAGSDIVKILDNESIQQLLSQLTGANISTSMINDVIDIYNQQESAVAELVKALETNMTEISTTLQNLLATNTENIFQSLNTTYLRIAGNVSADELIEQLCTKGEIAMLDAELNKTLCGENKELAQEVAQTLLDYSTTLESLQNMAEYDSASFWDTVSKDISALVGNIEGLANVAALVEQLGTVDITNLGDDTELLKLLQRVLVDNGPDAFLNNLENLLDTFSLIDNDEITNALLLDINILADGIFAFSSLRQMTLANVKISELVKDTESLKTYMMQSLDLPEDVALAILDGSISIEMLISAAEVDVSEWVCNATKLADVLQFDNSSITNAGEISTAFCAINSSTISSLVNEMIMQLDIGDFVEDIIINSGDFFNMSMEETKDAVKSIITANDDLQSLTETFNNFAETIPEAFANLAVAQTGQQEFGSFSSILCGTQIPMIQDEFSTGDIVEQSKELSTAQRRELNSLPGMACKDMYVKIMQDRNGPIIWAYLKPLMRGKILYTPKTPVVDTIIAQINSSFASLEEFVDLAVTWAEGSVSLVDISGDSSKDLQELLKSNLVQGMLTELADVSANSFDDLLYTLESTDMNMMKGISKIADMIQTYISCVLLDRFEGYDDEASMESAAARLNYNNELLAGLVFDTSVGEGTTRKRRDAHGDIPHHIHYTIRMDIDNVADTNRIKDRMWRPQPYDDFFTEMRYFRGFIQLQDMVDQAIISLHGGNVTLSSSTTKQLPFPCHTYDLFVNTIAGYLLNVIMTLSWLAGISVAVYNLVYDRERGQEETLVAMGMKPGLNWIAWFFTTMFIMAIVAIIDVLLLRYGNIFSKSSVAIMYLFFLDFIFSTIMLSYFVSAFFTRTSLAILATVIVYVVSYLPFVILFVLEINMKFWHKTLACLSSTTAFSYAAQYIARYEEQNIGLNWDNVDLDPLKQDDFSFSWCCIMIAIDGCIYFVLGWYVRMVKPGKFGVAEPWYFIFSPAWWCGASRSNNTDNRYAPSNDGAFVEETNNPSPVVLSARGLSKTFSDGTQAVKNLNMDIHAGGVTTILGHNGAAKTTTMSMMIGILEPTEGEVRISNRPLKSMKGQLGICSQHNALYDYMTVQEHMEFYSSVKGSYIGSSAKEEVRKLLKDVDLWIHRDVKVKDLSGGMQRRLCVALSFVGGSRAVVLDEPTSGVDPSGRRAIWNLIIQRKTDSAVLLSTHHLDEADIVSDQIAIMHEGRVMCHGSPMFLKHHLASGHRLTVTKAEIDDDTTPILNVIKNWIPGATLQQTVGTELTFVLPTVKDSDFYGLFTDLENQTAQLNIISYGISDPKLEEVFMKVCAAADAGVNVSPESLKELEDKMAENNGTHDAKFDMDGAGTDRQGQEKHSGSRSTFSALLGKRLHHYRRDWRIVISVLILPLLLVLLSCGLYKVRPEMASYPSIYLSPAMYGPDSYVFVNQHSGLDIGDSVLKSFMNKPGIGTSCMKGMNLGAPYKCVTPDSDFSMPDYDNSSLTGECTCDDNEYKCVGSPYGKPPTQMVTTTTDIMQDLYDTDVVDYLLKSYPEFMHNRFGGWSFADVQDGSEMKLKATVWYNNQGYHALPAFFNAFSNGLLRSVVNESAETYGISTNSHPFVFSKERLSKATIVKHASDMGIAVMILLAFTFIPVGILMYAVNEHVNKEKHMQFVSGVIPFKYWIASLIWDLLILGVAIGVSVIILLIFQPGSFWERQNLQATVCLLALYGWSTITFVYMLVKRFKSASSAFFTMFLTFMFIGIITVLLVFSFNFFASSGHKEVMKDVHDVLQYVFLIFPPYALGGGLLDLINNYVTTTIYARFNADVYRDPFTFEMLGWNLFAMGVEGLIFFILTIWMDLKFCCSRRYERCVSETGSEDEDVLMEKKRVDSGTSRQDVVVVRNLHKIYDSRRSREVHAVNGLSFGVPQGQCFGLLGINGAGKSTTFNILTGMLDSSCGSTYILNTKIEPGTSSLGDKLGYCPQVDALDPYLSILNTLNFHVKLKNLSGSAAKRAVEKVMNKLDLNVIKNKTVRSCSGGMKRRLSLAVALLGDPAVVLLDEPTSGMDPKAKRLVWNCLLEAKQNGQAIILTSHSLEECDVLCDRIGIMVNGEFKCLGSSQHLKQKYGDGYTVMLYMGSGSSSNHIRELIDAHFPGATVTDQHVNVVQLDIPKHRMKVADVFSVLEQEKGDYNIIYYTVSETTLDTIFLNFAREQTDGADQDVDGRRSSDADSLSTPPSSSMSNPFYARVNPALVGDSDKEKLRPESMEGPNPSYILPAKNTFVEAEQDAYSTKL